MGRLKDQKGFSVTELLIASAIVTLAFYATAQLLVTTTKVETAATDKDAIGSQRTDLLTILQSRCAINNSLLDDANNALDCLRAGTCANNATGGFILKDTQDQIVYSPEQLRGRVFGANGADCSDDLLNCRTQVDLKYKILCPNDDCTLAYLVVAASYSEYSPARSPSEALAETPSTSFTNYAKLNFERQIETPRVYRNCTEAYDDGKTASGLYWLDPDGAGGVCAFQAFCDQGRSGGGWALVANASRLDYQTLTDVPPPLLKGQSGRLQKELIDALLRASSAPAGSNSVIVDVRTGTATDFVLSFATAAGGGSKYITQQRYCQGYEGAAIATTKHTGEIAFLAMDAENQIGFTGDRFKCATCGDGPCEVCEISSTTCPNPQVGGSVWVK